MASKMAAKAGKVSKGFGYGYAMDLIKDHKNNPASAWPLGLQFAEVEDCEPEPPSEDEVRGWGIPGASPSAQP